MSRGFLRLSALAVYTYMHAVVQLVATASPPSRPVQHDPTATANGTPRSVALFRQSASEEARAAQLDALQRSAAMWTDADAPSSTVRRPYSTSAARVISVIATCMQLTVTGTVVIIPQRVRR